MKKFLSLATLISTSVWANLHLAPPDFESAVGRAVFVDFQTAEYEITYDTSAEEARVKSKITFIATKKGHPIFDLIPFPQNVRLNGEEVDERLISLPGNVSKVRLLSQSVTPGLHTLEMEHVMGANVIFWNFNRGISSAFWIRDLSDRMFLEQYLPTNLEFDQYKMTMNINFEGDNFKQDIYTNGKLTKFSESNYRIEFPPYFTTSSVYFHTTPRGAMKRSDYVYTSISGKKIPVTVYSPYRFRTAAFKRKSFRMLEELEADYGPWGHDSFVGYGTMPGVGGMEHSGAAQTSLAALDHEMLHSYFAKGVMPANGNSGWIDEAIASWRDNGYPRYPAVNFVGSNLGGHSIYKRNTDKRCYKLGNLFMAYLDYRLQDMGGLKAFLKGYFQTYNHTLITTEHFLNNLEFFSGLSLREDFEKYIWGQNVDSLTDDTEFDPHHAPVTASQLKSIL
ncbi:MAG: hypothetical protein AB7I27_01535 [Bacteriovoracaceae bacterium]